MKFIKSLFILWLCLTSNALFGQTSLEEKNRLIKSSEAYYTAKKSGLVATDIQLGTKKMYRYLDDDNIIIIQLRDISLTKPSINAENPFEKLDKDVKNRQGKAHPTENDLKFSFKEFGESKSYGGKQSITDIEPFAGWSESFSRKVVFFSENPPSSIKNVKREKLNKNEMLLIDSIYDTKTSKEYVAITPDKKVQYIDREDLLNLENLLGKILIQKIHYVAVVKQSRTTSSEATIEVKPSLGIEPYSFKWNSAQTTALIKNLSGGNYICTITDSKGNKRVTDTIVIRSMSGLRVDTSTVQGNMNNNDGKESELEKSIKIYPNPTTGKINIEIHNATVPVDISIMDITGKQIAIYTSFVGKEINLNNYNDGIYTLTISNGSASFSKKILLHK